MASPWDVQFFVNGFHKLRRLHKWPRRDLVIKMELRANHAILKQICKHHLAVHSNKATFQVWQSAGKQYNNPGVTSRKTWHFLAEDVHLTIVLHGHIDSSMLPVPERPFSWMEIFPQADDAQCCKAPLSNWIPFLVWHVPVSRPLQLQTKPYGWPPALSILVSSQLPVALIYLVMSRPSQRTL